MARYVERLLQAVRSEDGRAEHGQTPRPAGPATQELPFSTIEEAIEEIRRGRMVVVCDGEDRENEGDLVLAAQFATPEAINFMAKQAAG